MRRLSGQVSLARTASASFELLIHGDRVVAVSDRRHVCLDAVLFAPLDELPANFRIFILVFDQGAAFAQTGRRSFAVVARAGVVDGRRILAAGGPAGGCTG